MALSPQGSAAPTLVDAPGTISEVAGAPIAKASSDANPLGLKLDKVDAGAPSDPEKAVEDRYEGHGTAESPYVVRWLEGDKANPLLWSQLRKWTIVQVIAIATLCGSTVWEDPRQELTRRFLSKVSRSVAASSREGSSRWSSTLRSRLSSSLLD